ncbi:MAG: CoA-binding protein, partial [Desulfohalobiaceae bacterium]|nr:CoA-binding protein [Desulfohalobiaceae bacterium]
MSIFNLEHLFNPASVAVIGASEKSGSIGSALMQNMLQAGFPGRLIPVNPNSSTVHGLPALPDIREAAEAVDLAVIATPIATVPGIIDGCVQAGVKGAVIISAGGKESGTEGREIEARIKNKAAEGRMRLIGPNCLGIICPENRVNASFA